MDAGTQPFEVEYHVANFAPVAMMAVDQSGRILFASDDACVMFGWTRRELLMMSVDDLVPDDVRPTHAGKRAKYAEHPTRRVKLPLRGKKRSGVEFPVDIVLNPTVVNGIGLVTTLVLTRPEAS